MHKEEIIALICDFVLTSDQNLHEGKFRFYDAPLVGFAAADDPIFLEFKTRGIIGPHFKLPAQWLPSAKTVISFFLPSTEYVRRSNYEKVHMSDAWIHARFLGESFIFDLRRHLIACLAAKGAKAMAPVLDPEFKINEEKISNWSERHIAYAAGLGTFSRNRGLITVRGMAGRFGSVITDFSIEPNMRPYQDPFAYCIKCTACITRCPANAITPAGQDKDLCLRYLINKERTDYNKALDHYPYAACGKCQTKVPCESGIPQKA